MNNYKKITLLKGDKVISALEIKKKRTNLVYCKKLFKKLTRTNSNSSTNSSLSTDSDYCSSDNSSYQDQIGELEKIRSQINSKSPTKDITIIIDE